VVRDGGVPKEAWQSWEEPFRVSYRDYVAVQREKEAGIAGVREALSVRASMKSLIPHSAAVSHFHMGALCMVEQMAVTMLGQFALVCSQSALAQHLSVRHA